MKLKVFPMITTTIIHDSGATTQKSKIELYSYKEAFPLSLFQVIWLTLLVFAILNLVFGWLK